MTTNTNQQVAQSETLEEIAERIEREIPALVSIILKESK